MHAYGPVGAHDMTLTQPLAAQTSDVCLGIYHSS